MVIVAKANTYTLLFCLWGSTTLHFCENSTILKDPSNKVICSNLEERILLRIQDKSNSASKDFACKSKPGAGPDAAGIECSLMASQNWASWPSLTQPRMPRRSCHLVICYRLLIVLLWRYHTCILEITYHIM